MITVGSKVKSKTGTWKALGEVIEPNEKSGFVDGTVWAGWSLVKWESAEHPCPVFNGHLELA